MSGSGTLYSLLVWLGCLICSCVGYDRATLATGRSFLGKLITRTTVVAASNGNTALAAMTSTWCGRTVLEIVVGMFGGRGGLTSSISSERELSEVLIEAFAAVKAHLATILVDDEIDEVWKIITDYNNLANHVPNLVQSYVVQENPASKYSYRIQIPREITLMT